MVLLALDGWSYLVNPKCHSAHQGRQRPSFLLILQVFVKVFQRLAIGYKSLLDYALVVMHAPEIDFAKCKKAALRSHRGGIFGLSFHPWVCVRIHAGEDVG